MEKLQILYIILAIVGAFFLVLSIFGGDGDVEVDLDVGDVDFDISDAESPSDSVSVFSIRTLATFLLGFGLAGWSVMRGDGGVGWQIIAGFGAGLFISFLYFLVMRLMYSMQGSSMASVASLVGKEGIITIPTTESGVAQVKVSTEAGFKEYTCKEVKERKLAHNETVTITSGSIGLGTLQVEKVKS